MYNLHPNQKQNPAAPLFPQLVTFGPRTPAKVHTSDRDKNVLSSLVHASADLLSLFIWALKACLCWKPWLEACPTNTESTSHVDDMPGTCWRGHYCAKNLLQHSSCQLSSASWQSRTLTGQHHTQWILVFLLL